MSWLSRCLNLPGQFICYRALFHDHRIIPKCLNYAGVLIFKHPGLSHKSLITCFRPGKGMKSMWADYYLYSFIALQSINNQY